MKKISFVAVCLLSACCWGAERDLQRVRGANEVVKETNDRVETSDGTVYTFEDGQWKGSDGKVHFMSKPDDEEPHAYMIPEESLSDFDLVTNNEQNSNLIT